MRAIKRVVTAALSVAMVASSLVGCGHKTTSSSKKEEVTIQCYSQLANYQGEQVGWFGQILKDKFNVKMNITMESGNILSTLMEKGDLGDLVVWGSAGDEYLACAEKGLLLDWEANGMLDEHGAYIKEHMGAALEYNRQISGTGKVYGIGHSVATSSDNHDQFFYSWDLRYDYYDELGCPEIKDLEELRALLKQMKEKHPTGDNGKETYGISIWPDWDGNMVMYPKALATAYYGYDEFGLGLYNNETGEFYDALQINDDGSYGPYLEMVHFFNELYQDGLLDPDSDIQTYDEALAKVKTGRALWSIFNYSGSSAFNTDDNKAAGKGMYTVLPEDANPCVYGMNVRGGNRIWSIGASTQYAGRCMDIINYLCTPEGWLDQQYGPQGLCWYYGDDIDGNGLPNTYFTELGAIVTQKQDSLMESDDPDFKDYCGAKFSDGQQQMNNLTWAVDAVNPDTGETFNYKNWASQSVPPAEGSLEAKWRAYAKKKLGTEGEVVSPDAFLDARGKFSVAKASDYSEGKKDSDLKDVWDQVTTVIVTYSWKAIEANSDKEFKDIVDDMIKKANAYDNGKGYQECVDWSKAEAAKRKACEDKIAQSE